MSKKFLKVKNYYINHLWNKEQVRNAVIKNWITELEYEDIVGERYQVRQ